MDILNFISWIKAGKYNPTAPNNAVTVVGVPNPTRGDAYLPVTVPITTLATNIGKQIGGGLVVAEWFENGVHKALIIALQDLSVNTGWTISPYDITAIGATAQSYSDGLTNTNAIIAQTGAAATTAYAAGLAKLYLGGGYNDWYLPSIWELSLCFNSIAIIGKSISTIGFNFINNIYWSSTEYSSTEAWALDFLDGVSYLTFKNSGNNARAVRIHTF
jgi:hypothetical protein